MASPELGSGEMNILPGHCEGLQDVSNIIDRQTRHPDAAFGTGSPEPANIETPEFNLFFPEFSSLESELVGLGMGALEFPL